MILRFILVTAFDVVSAVCNDVGAVVATVDVEAVETWDSRVDVSTPSAVVKSPTALTPPTEPLPVNPSVVVFSTTPTVVLSGNDKVVLTSNMLVI